jgi:hypothetical protein
MEKKEVKFDRMSSWGKPLKMAEVKPKTRAINNPTDSSTVSGF